MPREKQRLLSGNDFKQVPQLRHYLKPTLDNLFSSCAHKNL